MFCKAEGQSPVSLQLDRYYENERVICADLDDHCGRVLRFDVLARAALTVAASPNLEVERAVDLVLLTSICDQDIPESAWLYFPRD